MANHFFAFSFLDIFFNEKAKQEAKKAIIATIIIIKRIIINIFE